MSLNNNTDSMQCKRCDGWYCKFCSNINEAFDIFCNVSSAHWFCVNYEPKAIEAVKMDKLVEEKCEKCFNNLNVRMMKLEKSQLEQVQMMLMLFYTDVLF